MESEISGDDESYGSYYSTSYPDYPLYSPCNSLDFMGDQNLEDRISSLPDSILIHVLSFLPTKDAIKTSALSKKFQSLWALTTTLHFLHEPNPLLPRHEDIRSFASSVDRTLILHNRPKLTKFRLGFDCGDHFRPRVDLWVRVAVRREVEEVDLDFLGTNVINESYGMPYELPISLCTSSTLTKLSLIYCRLGDRKRTICWNSLKRLSLGYMELCDESIRDILSGSPLLEVLELRECSGFNRLDISSPRVKRLEIYGYGDFYKSDFDLEISAPRLQSLGIYGSFHRKLKLINVNSVEDAALNFRLFQAGGDTDKLYKGYCEFMNELFLKIISVRILTLGTWCLQVLSVQEMMGMGSPGLQAKCLTLDTRFNKWDLQGIKSLLRNSTILERLVLNMHPPFTAQFSFSQKFIDSYNFDGENYWTKQNLVFQCMENHLKTVKIAGFTGGQYEIGFIQFILKKAVVLEKMIIYTEKAEHLKRMKHFKAEELLQVVRRMLSFRRASSNAVILFSW